ncbi:MAG: glycosyltransferase family 39 protein [Acidobacteria bacterium]|nr:glycosyltransferase family 39 protein [Acidobacteriota bacterium]
MFSRHVAWTLAGVCLAGALLRFWAIDYGLPGLYHPDETPILNRALTFAKGDPNPHNFLYPTLHLYALFVWQGLFFLAGWAVGLFDSVQAFQEQFFVDPSYHFIAGRALTATLGTVTLVAVYRIGRRLHSPAAGVAAAIFLAVAPFAVRDAHYVKLDVPAAFMIALAHVSLARLAVDGDAASRVRPWLLAGVLGGLAVSTQYYVAPIVATFIAVAMYHGHRTGHWTTTFRLLVCAGAAFIAGFFAGTPFILTELDVTARDIAEVRQVNFERALDTGGPLSSLWPYIVMLATDALGWPVFALAVVGAGLVLARNWGRGLVLVTFPLTYLVFISNTVPMSRYLACVVPLVATAAGVGVMEIAGRVQSRRGAGWTPVAAGMVALAALPGLLLSVRSNQFFAQDDTRGLAKAFIEQHLPAESSILIQPQSAPVHMSRQALIDALRLHLGDESRASVKFQYQMAATPYPSPAYRLVFLGDGGQDVDRTYVSLRGFTSPSVEPLRQRGIEYVVMKRTNVPNPETAIVEQALEREATRIATFSPYREGVSAEVQAVTDPYFHNTATRIVPALERPGPIVDIWKIQ